jgi:8-oxo-dGTP diphosphatase
VNQFGTAMPYIASYVVLRQSGKIAFVLRSSTGWMDNYYGLPSGKVEISESFTLAAIREAREEVGVEVTPQNLKYLLTVHRRDEIDWIDAYFEALEWHGEPVNAEPHLHSELAWLDPDNLPENVVPSVRFALEQIEAGKSYCEYGWA